MTSPTNRDARDRLAAALERLANAADCYGVAHLDTDDLDKDAEELQAATLAARALLSPDEVEGMGSDQPLPSVATGHPEQGALLSGWQDISTAPKPWAWMSTRCARFLLARLYQPTDEDGEVSGPTELVWSHVAYITASGWMLPLQGVTGLHGYGSLPLSGATHWMRLPADGEGRVPSSTTDASQASGTNPKPPRQGGE